MDTTPSVSDGSAGTSPAPGSPNAHHTMTLEECIQRALASNATIRAARWNVEALKHRIPQVTSLDDPIVSNTIYPIPAVAPQYALMGYMPYSVLLAQQFPWFGTLRLRGQAAAQDVQIAIFELCATQLDVVESVKRAYHDLQLSRRAEELLIENRSLAGDFLEIARERYRTATATQADVLRAQVTLSDIDQEIELIRESANEAEAELARLLQLGPDARIRVVAEPVPNTPGEIDRLYRLALVNRPDLQGRLAALARDRTAVELALKRYKPNVTLGITYALMEERGAVVGQEADGMPNLGMFVGFNLPVYRGKLDAGVREAQARAAVDAALYESERDQSQRDIRDLFVQARVQRNVLGLLQRSNLPAARQVLELTAGDYRAGIEGVDLLSVVSASRDLLQVELQIAQLEAEYAKTLASLERAVGVQLNEHPPDPSTLVPPLEPSPAPPPTGNPGPFEFPDDASDAVNAPQPLDPLSDDRPRLD